MSEHRHPIIMAALAAALAISASSADTLQPHHSLLGSGGSLTIAPPQHRGLLRPGSASATDAAAPASPAMPLPEELLWHPGAVAGAQLQLVSNRPISLPQGKRGRRAMWVLAATGALIATDRSSMRALGSAFRGDGDAEDEEWLSGVETFGGTGGVASVLGLYALGDRYDKQTARIASRALGKTILETQALKTLTGRDRPRDSDGRGPFHGPSAGDTAHSFPSGHAAAAFTLATVYGERYPKWKWPLYGLAAGVGWARMRHNAHFPSDVFVGAAIGIHNGHKACRRAGKKRPLSP